MGVDASTNFALAFYDLDKRERDIHTLLINCSKMSISEKIWHIRRQMPAEVRLHSPVFAIIEEPLPFTRISEVEKNRARSKRAKRDMFAQAGEGAAPKTDFVATDIRAVIQISEIAGAAAMLLCGLDVEWEFAQPRTWQSIIPPEHKRSRNPKDNTKAFCDVLGIHGATNEHTRDAALMAVYGAGRYQTLMLERRPKVDEKGFDL